MSAAILIDQVIAHLGLKNDAALARHLGIAPPTISKIRNGLIPMSAAVMARLSEDTGWPTKQIKAVIAEGDGQEGGAQ
ncbi:hypothetical protein G5S34_17460 [Herbaspirillum frisingense]|uniref:hypothetical protein n=1 Tax=Herbaspirillum frisingense TaxID=92645 RepID=UPI0015FED412|nr:hypothetical protein [Herbaspirillum frisingense]QNB08363.1 hypothetical protein G5S34_17460 [Herbaspirillum frisingense]